MADVKWIKITTDIFDDEKILLIESLPDSYAIITVWFKLLCLAGKQNNSGVFMMGQIAYTDKMLATIFRMKESTVTMALKTFESFGMIEIIDGVITIPNWEKHQSLDKFELAKEKTRQRVARHREKQKLLAECNADGNVTVTQSNANRIEEDKDKEEDKDNSIETKRKRFVPPTLEEVQAYCYERNNGVDAERFIDYYTSNGWQVGKNKMKDWKAAVRTWERNGYSGKQSAPQKSGTSDFMAELQSLYNES
jgi:predicted phage replisome organizer